MVFRSVDETTLADSYRFVLKILPTLHISHGFDLAKTHHLQPFLSIIVEPYVPIGLGGLSGPLQASQLS